MPSNPYEIRGSFKGIQTILANFQQIEKTLRDIERAAKDVKSATGSMGAASIQRTRQTTQAITQQTTAMQRLAEAGQKYKQAMDDGRQVMRDFVSPFRELQQSAMKLGVAQAQLKALNLGADETQKAFAAIDRTVQSIGGLRTSNVTADLINLKSVVGDLGDAIDLLPTVAKQRFTFQALFEGDPKALENDIRDTLKAIEQLGGARQLAGGGFDTERFKKFLDVAAKIKAYTRGGIGGAQLRAFSQTSGVAGMQLSPEGLMNLTSVMESMGGGQVGTALMSQIQSFVAFRQGAGGQRSFENMAKLGLLRPLEQLQKEGLVETTKEGRIKKLRPGALPIADLLGEDPLQFADAMAEAIKKHGENVVKRKEGQSDETFLTQVLSQVTGSRTSMNLLAKMILLRDNIRKDVENMKRAMGSEELFTLAKDSDVGKVITFTEALEDFKERVGLPLLATLGALGTAAKPFLDLIASHPQIAFWTFAIGKATVSLFQMLNVVRQFQAANTIISGMGKGLGGAAGNATKFGSAIGKINWSTVGIGIAALTALLLLIKNLREEAEKAWGEAGDTSKSEAKSMLKLYGAKGVDDADIYNINQRRSGSMLKQLTEGYEGRFGGGESGTTGFIKRLFGSKDTAVFTPQNMEKMMETMQPLKFPSQYLMFQQRVQDSDISEQRKQIILDAMAKKFPASQEAVNKVLPSPMIQSPTQIAAAIDTLIEQDRKAAGVALDLAGKQKLLGESTDALKGRFDALTPKGPDGLPVIQPPESTNARGGLMRRDHLARVHRGEAVIPGGAGAREFFRQAGIGTSDINLTVNAPIYASPGTNTADVKRAVFEGVMAGKHELERALTTMQNDRRLGGNG